MTRNTRTTKGDTEYQTAVSSNPNTKHPTLFTSQDQLRPLSSSTQRKTTSKRSLILETVEESETYDVPSAIHSRAIAEAITTAMSMGLEPLLAAKETKSKPTKHCGTRDGIVDGWLMLMKRYLEKAHAKDTPLDRFGTRSNKIQIQQQFRTCNQSLDEDYMRYLDVLESLRS